MTAVCLTPSSAPQILPSASHIRNAIKQIKHHSDVISSLTYFTLNSCLLLQKACSQVPRVVGDGAQLALSYVGVISTPTTVGMLEKSFTDLTRAIRVKEREGVVALSVKIVSKTIDLFLSLGGFGIAIARLAGKTTVVFLYYRYTVPLAMVSLIGAIALDLYRPSAKRELGDRLIAIAEESDQRVEMVFSEIKSDHTVFASKVLRNIDHYVFEDLKQNLSKQQTVARQREIIRGIGNYFQSAHHAAIASIGLRALGYVSMVICRAYPDSLTQALTTWTIGAMYTAKMFYRKYSEHKIQETMAGK